MKTAVNLNVLMIFCQLNALNATETKTNLITKPWNQVNVLNETLSKQQLHDLKNIFRLVPELRIVLPFFKSTEYQTDRDIINSSSTNNTRCKNDIANLALSLSERWTLPLIDSYGKPPSGILRGNFFWPGNYDQCRSFEAPETNLFPSGFEGRYCLLKINIKNNIGVPSITGLSIGICIPNSCDSPDFNDLNTTNYLNSIMANNYTDKIPLVKDLVKELPDARINCLPESTPLNTASVVFVVLVSIIAAFVLAGTGYDVYVRYYPELKPSVESKTRGEELRNGETSMANNGEPINDTQHAVIVTKKTLIVECLLCFSILKNGQSLLDTSVKPGQLNCVHGIRFISMSWIILGHTYVFGMAQTGNLLDILDQYNNWHFMVIVNGKYSVDTFFLLSGFLLTYLFLKDKNTFTLKKLGVFYAHRYIRLTPVYMMVIFALASFYNFMGNGPYWPYQDQESNICSKYWWKNLFYINNMFINTEDCASWTWYLANDMQFFIISPLFLVFMKSPIRKWRYVGLGIALTLLLTSWMITIIIVVVGKISAQFDIEAQTAAQTFDKIYNKPWTRIGPHLIGCILAYVIVQIKGNKNFLTRFWNIVFWSVAITLGLINIYGNFKANFNLTKSAFYYALSSSSWSVAVAWVIFACLTGHANPVDKLLSWKLFFPLSRLTYCTYLLHPIVMSYYYQNMRSPVMVSNTYLAIHYLGFTILSYGVAFVASLAFESPIIRLEKLLREGVNSKLYF